MTYLETLPAQRDKGQNEIARSCSVTISLKWNYVELIGILQFRRQFKERKNHQQYNHVKPAQKIRKVPHSNAQDLLHRDSELHPTRQAKLATHWSQETKR